jgi:hypothetical protein
LKSKLFLIFLYLAGSLVNAQVTTRFEPPPDEYDWVQLTSDEWLKGELVSLYDDNLRFDSDNFGMIYIDMEDVHIIRAFKPMRVGIQGTDTLRGAVRLEGNQVRIGDEASPAIFPRKRLISITRQSEREIDNWGGDIAFGLNITDGNTDIVEYNMMATVVRRSAANRATFDYLGYFNETDGERAASTHRFNNAIDRFTGNRIFWRPFIGQYFRDKFQNIASQVTLETGFGYTAIDNSKIDWELSAAVGVNYIDYDSVQPGKPDDNTSPAFTLITDSEMELTPWMDWLFLFQATVVDSDSGTYQHHLVTTLSTEFIGNFDLDISVVWDRTQKPQQRNDGTTPDKNDYRLMVALAYEF